MSRFTTDERVCVLKPVGRARPAALTPLVNFGVFNARSVHNKAANICDWIATSKLRLAAVVETWHDSRDCPNLIACAPPGYCFIECARPRHDADLTSVRVNHGGVCLFHHSSLKAKCVDFGIFKSFEYISAYVSGSTLTLLVIVIYRPGSVTVSELFFDEFSELLDRTATYASSLVIAGDINIHLDISTDHSTVKFNDILDLHGLIQHVTGPTQVAGHCLDVLITRHELSVRSVVVSPPSLSDHSTIVGQLDLLVPQCHSTKRRTCRRWREFNFDKFMNDLQQSPLVTELTVDAGVDELFNHYDSTMSSLLDIHAPSTTVSVRSAGVARWYDAECRDMKKITRSLEKQYRRLKSAAIRQEWQTQFEAQRQLFHRKLSDYWLSTIDSCKNDPRALWSKVSDLMSPPVQSDTCFSADQFAMHFTSKIEKIRVATANAPSPLVIHRSVAPLDTFTPVTVEEIIRLLARLPAKHCVLDPVPTWLVKRAADVLAPILTVMCNASLQSGYLPRIQKHAIVSPRLKKPSLDSNDINSYRPVSNLSFISKLVEKVVATRFTEHAECNNLFPPRQSAYRRHHSTETAVISIMNDIIRATDNGQITALVLLDLSAAFDTVDHSTLIDVLHRSFAVDGQPLTWFKSYLSDRTQTFSTASNQSTPLNVECSVPQGSVLGPLEFISYTENIREIFDSFKITHHLFADDKQLLKSSEINNIDSIQHLLSSCISVVRDWCSSRRLQLNASKTELIWFGSHCNINKLSNTDLTVTVGSDVIQPVSVVRDLGVYLDSELTMKEHVRRITRSCFFQLRRLRQIRRSAGPEVMKRLVSALILSRLDYCNAALAGLPQSTIQPLQRAQNAAARLISNSSRYEHITPVLKQLHWLPVNLRIKYKLCLLMHLIHTHQCPQYLKELVTTTSSIATRPGLRSSSSLSYHKPWIRTKFGERAFSIAGPAAWNSLPSSLQATTNTNCFKRQLKTHLFNSHY